MIKKTIAFGFSILNKYVVMRYLLVGGTAGVTDLAVLYFLHDVLHVHYLISAIIAFLIAFCISFTFHRFWTFKSMGDTVRKQVVMYLLSSGFGLLLNTGLMYVFVGHLGVHVLLSQIYVGLLVACCSFFISRNIVFKYKPV